jgi:hypothetical protein
MRHIAVQRNNGDRLRYTRTTRSARAGEAQQKRALARSRKTRLIEDKMAYLSRLFGSLIWIIRCCHIALQHLVTI